MPIVKLIPGLNYAAVLKLAKGLKHMALINLWLLKWTCRVQSNDPRHLEIVLARSRYQKIARPSRDCDSQ